MSLLLNQRRLTVKNDGTTVLLQSGDNKLLKIRISDGQLLIAGGTDTDQTL